MTELPEPRPPGCGPRPPGPRRSCTTPASSKALTGLSGRLGDTAQAALVDVRHLAHDAQQLLAGEGDDIRADPLVTCGRLAADGARPWRTMPANNPSRVLFGQPPPHSP